MAWRPHEYLIDGELDNTNPGRVTGWMRFAGLKRQVTFDLKGNFHRDIRGAKIGLKGTGRADNPEAVSAMARFKTRQTGDVGDMTAGREPVDYVAYPYFEWYGDDNGRVVIELDPEQVEVLGRPIPACESDPISRQQQQHNMADWLARLSQGSSVPAVLAGSQTLVSDPAFSHWVEVEDQIVGEAHSVESESDGACLAYVRLFASPEGAEFGSIKAAHLRPKSQQMGNRRETTR